MTTRDATSDNKSIKSKSALLSVRKEKAYYDKTAENLSKQNKATIQNIMRILLM